MMGDNEDLETIDKIYSLDEIKTMMKELMDDKEIYEVILFGSYAKGCPNSESDLDLIIDSDRKYLGFKKYGLINDLEQKFLKQIDCFEKCEIIKDSRIDNEIRKTGVKIYEKDRRNN